MNAESATDDCTGDRREVVAAFEAACAALCEVLVRGGFTKYPHIAAGAAVEVAGRLLGSLAVANRDEGEWALGQASALHAHVARAAAVNGASTSVTPTTWQ